MMRMMGEAIRLGETIEEALEHANHLNTKVSAIHTICWVKLR